MTWRTVEGVEGELYELEDGSEVIVEVGVEVSEGHCMAAYEDLIEAIESGEAGAIELEVVRALVRSYRAAAENLGELREVVAELMQLAGVETADELRDWVLAASERGVL